MEFKDEESILAGVEDVDKAYIEDVLPKKMEYNLKDIKDFSVIRDMGIMWKTFFAVV